MGVAAGSGGTSIILKNISRTTCSLDGYPSVRLLSAAGSRIRTTVDHGPAMVLPPNLRVRMIKLGPGESARVYFAYTNPGDFIGQRGFKGCPWSASVRLTPPGDRTAITVKLSISGVGGTGRRLRCDEISISPVTRTIKGWA